MHRYISAKKYIIKDNRYCETIPDQKCKWISPLSNFITESAPIREATKRKALVRTTEPIFDNRKQRTTIDPCNEMQSAILCRSFWINLAGSHMVRCLRKMSKHFWRREDATYTRPNCSFVLRLMYARFATFVSRRYH